MKRLAPLFLAFLTLTACFAPGSTTYKDVYASITFQYPANWLLQRSNTAERNIGVVAWLYDPQAAVAVKECQVKYRRLDWSRYCGAEQAAATIGIYNEGLVNYATLDDTERQNFPSYAPWYEGSNVFEYDGRTNPPTHHFQVNFPKTAEGFKVTVFSPTRSSLAVGRSIAETIATTAR